MAKRENRFRAMSEALQGKIQPEQVESPSPSRKRGGKRSNPDCVQVGAYIPKDLKRQVQKLLIDEEDLDFSDLVTQLLADWVKRQSD